MIFRDRRQAGEALAERAAAIWGPGEAPLVLALPRGGVPVALPIAKRLGSELDVFVVRKLGLPGHPELAMGALASGGVRLMNEEIVRSFKVRPNDIEVVIEREQAELRRRESLYRGDGPAPVLEGRDVLLVDDGLATGATARTAVAALRKQGARRLALSVPVGAPDVVDLVAKEVDELIVLEKPRPFDAVGRWYRDFREVSDQEVVEMLDRRESNHR